MRGRCGLWIACLNLKDFVQTYAKAATRLAEWAEKYIPEELTVFQLPRKHQKRMRTSNSIERLNKEIKRRTRVATLFPNNNLYYAWSAQCCRRSVKIGKPEKSISTWRLNDGCREFTE